jgi:hypothetical protein
VAGHALADDSAGFDIERREQRCRPMPLVVVCAPLDLPGPHREERLRTVERLHLAFLIDTQHDCTFGWRQVEPDDIAYFLYEQRIGGELESLDAVGLQTEGAPDAMHRRRRMTDLFSHAPEAPVCATLWSRLQRFADRARDFVVANLAWRAGPRLVVETVHSSLGKAVPPSADRVRADAKLRGDLFVLQTASRRQHNARPLGQCLRRPVLACQCRQIAPYNIVEFDRNSSTLPHLPPP